MIESVCPRPSIENACEVEEVETLAGWFERTKRPGSMPAVADELNVGAGVDLGEENADPERERDAAAVKSGDCASLGAAWLVKPPRRDASDDCCGAGDCFFGRFDCVEFCTFFCFDCCGFGCDAARSSDGVRAKGEKAELG